MSPVNDPYQSTAASQGLMQRSYYPSPFFDISRLYMPNNIKEMIKWCRFYFYTHPIVSRVITTLAEYPVNDFIIQTKDEDLKRTYLDLLKNLKMRSFLIKFGIDYFVYGNCFASIYFPFTRFLRCKQCGQEVNIKNMDYKVRSYVPYGQCKKCQATTEFDINDVEMKTDVSRIRLRTWNPHNIEIEHNEISGETYYYLLVPARVRRGLMSGNPIFWESTPMWVINAVRENKYARFKEGKMFHFKRPSLTDENEEWGKSLILPVLREIFHFYTLRKAQESIAIDRIIPIRYFFPETQAGNIEPLYGKIDLGEWKGKIEDEIRKWKADPLYIAVMPIPIGVGTIGGEGKALMVFPEMEATSNMIENGLGMPTGFMQGNITYSGGNVVLRVWENSIITYNDQLEEFMQWVIDEVSTYARWGKVDVRMKDFKMAEDMDRKRLFVDLNNQGKLSDDTLFSEFGINAEKEMEKVLQEGANKQKKYLESNIKVMDVLQGFVNQLNEMEEEARNSVMARMQQEMPETYGLIANKIKNPAMVMGGRNTAAAESFESEVGGENPVMPPRDTN